MKRNLILQILCAFALFFLLITGENLLLDQKQDYHEEITTSHFQPDFLISQHHLKANSFVKKYKLSESDFHLTPSGALSHLLDKSFSYYSEYLSKEVNKKIFLSDKRRIISRLLYPYHFFW